MSRLKQCIVILSIVLVVFVIAIVAIHYNAEKEKTKEHVADISGDIKTDIIKLDNYTTYNSIEKMMSNYYLYLRVKNKTAVYSLLDSEYVEQNDIEESNVISKCSQGNDVVSDFKVKEIYIKDHLQYPTYFVKVSPVEADSQKLYYIFYMDNSEGAFAIQPVTEQEYNSYVQGEENFETKENTISKNNYNGILRRSLEEDQIVKRYFDDYIQNALYNVKDSYNSLEEEYREKKFGNIEEYKKYLNKKNEQLTSMDYNSIKELEDFETEDEYVEYINNLDTKGLDKYKIVEYDDYTQYICVDDYGNYYIFNSTASFQYTVVLDIYTIDIPQILEKYNNSEENEKIQLNIQKLITATKDGDYKYVYNKLDESFKNNNFATQAVFEKYIKEKYNENDEITYTQYEKINNVHVYDIEITKTDGTTTKAQIVMQLKDGTDFVMSFSAVE